MTKQELFACLESVLEETHAGVLATIDLEGNPHLRWLAPALIPGRQGALFAVTSPSCHKVQELAAHPRVEWMFQNPALNAVITVRGTINILDNASIKAEVLEAVGPRLRAFWKLYQEERELLVLETILEEAVFYRPMSGRKETLRIASP